MLVFKAVGAMNEDFADLISFYSPGKDERVLNKVKCFEKNLEVDSPYFGAFISKDFTDNAIKIMDDNKVHESDESCDTPNYQRIHEVEAMFAYQGNRLISMTTQDQKTKLKILMKWAMTLAEEYKKQDFKDAKASKIFFHALENLYKLALEEASLTVSSSSCKVMRFPFPSQNVEGLCIYLVDQEMTKNEEETTVAENTTDTI